jgi:Zn-finger nucleic acid-binding protein
MRRATNRSEEKPPFDEHANDHRYFAGPEHQLIDELKFEFFQSPEAAQNEARMLTCPKCSGKFVKYGILGFDVDRCENCEGIWLNKGELAGILRRQAGDPLRAFLARWFANRWKTQKSK